VIITRCSVTGPAQDANYRQTVVCGRHELTADDAQRKGGNIGSVAVSLVLLEGAAGKTIERRVTLSESLDAMDTYCPERWFVSRNPGCYVDYI